MVLNLISILFDYYVIYDDLTKRTIRNILTEFIVADKIGEFAGGSAIAVSRTSHKHQCRCQSEAGETC
jgi:hypothetical protein